MTLNERIKRGQETSKRYKSFSGKDPYAGAVDAIADVLLAVAQNEREAVQILHSAEIEFRNMAESEKFMSEG